MVLVTDTGDLLEGMAALDHWRRQRKVPILKTLGKYLLTQEKYGWELCRYQCK